MFLLDVINPIGIAAKAAGMFYCLAPFGKPSAYGQPPVPSFQDRDWQGCLNSTSGHCARSWEHGTIDPGPAYSCRN